MGFSVMGYRAGTCLCAFWALLDTFQGGVLTSFGFRVKDLVSHEKSHRASTGPSVQSLKATFELRRWPQVSGVGGAFVWITALRTPSVYP